MSDMYALVFKRHPNYFALLKVIGLKEQDFYRIRDVFPTEDGQIAVYTRGGGANLDCTCRNRGSEGEWVNGTYHELTCALVKDQNVLLSPLSVAGKDDTFDNTYRTYTFTVPEKYKAAVAGMPAYKPRDEAWPEAFKRMQEDPDFTSTLATRMFAGQGPVAYQVTPDGPKEINLMDLLNEAEDKR